MINCTIITTIYFILGVLLGALFKTVMYYKEAKVIKEAYEDLKKESLERTEELEDLIDYYNKKIKGIEK